MQTTGRIERSDQTTDGFEQTFRSENRFPTYFFGKSKRIRNKNWELLEIQVLKKMIDNHHELLNSRHTNAMMNARKNLVWKRIADSINALGLNKRTVRELKIKWSNMRLTERRKSGHPGLCTSGANDRQGYNSGDTIDVSQSSYDSDHQLEIDLLDEQDKAQSERVGNVFPKDGSELRNNEDNLHSKFSESSRVSEIRHIKSDQQDMLEGQFQYQHATQSHQLQPNSHSSHSVPETVNIQPNRNNSVDFSKDRIYMPPVLVKPEPKDDLQTEFFHDRVSINSRQAVTTQTDWRLSCNHDFTPPTLTVNENDIATIKYEILKLEHAHLILKNENMELQNSKLKLELSKMQENIK